MDQDLRQQAAWMQLELQQFDVERKQKVKATFSAIAAVLDDFTEQAKKIKGDQELSAAGKEPRLRKLATKTAEGIDALTTGFIAELDARIAELSAIFARFVAGEADDSVRALLKIEARQCARRVDPLMLQVQYLQLCREGRDDLTCEAIEQAPFFDSLLKAATLEEGKAIRAARVKPNQAEELRQLRQMRETVAAEKASAKRQLLEYLPVDARENLRAA